MLHFLTDSLPKHTRTYMHLHLYMYPASSSIHAFSLLPHTPSTTSPHGSRPTKLHRATCYRHHLEPTIFFFFFLFSNDNSLHRFFHATTIASRSSSDAQALQSGRCRWRMTRCKGREESTKRLYCGPLQALLLPARSCGRVSSFTRAFFSFLLVPLSSFLHLSCFSLTKLLFLHLPHFFFQPCITTKSSRYNSYLQPRAVNETTPYRPPRKSPGAKPHCAPILLPSTCHCPLALPTAYLLLSAVIFFLQ